MYDFLQVCHTRLISSLVARVSYNERFTRHQQPVKDFRKRGFLRGRIKYTDIYIPGVSGALVNYFGRGVRCPEPWIVAASKGTKVRVCLS